MATEWTERGQEAIDRAWRIAREARKGILWPRHLFLGLISADTFARSILVHLGVDIDALRAQLEERTPPRWPCAAHADNPEFSATSIEILDAAGEAARELGLDRASTEHLLLAILRDKLSLAARALAGYGVDCDLVRDAIVEEASKGRLPSRPQPTPTTGWPELDLLLSHPARQVLDIARRCACHFEHGVELKEHALQPQVLLFALLHDSLRPVQCAVRNLGLDPARWRGDGWMPATSSKTAYRLPPPVSDDTRRVLDALADRARRLGQRGVGPEDLFLALMDACPELFKGFTPQRRADLRHEFLDIEGPDARWLANVLTGEAPSADGVMERLTPQARRVMAAAREEAWERGDDHLGAEHLLLALSRPGHGGGSAVLEHMGATHTRVREALDKLLGPPRDGAFVDPLPTTPEMENAIRVAWKEAEKRGHEQVGTECLLMGLLWQRDSTPARVLASLEVTIIRTRMKVQQIYDAALEYDVVGASSPMTCRARGILLLAQRRARESNLRAVDERLLLGAILAQQGGLAVRAMERIGIDLDALSRDLGAPAEAPRTQALVAPEVSPEVRHILDVAAKLLSGKGHTKVGSGDLLVAFLQEASTDRRDALAQLGLSSSRLATALAEVEATA